MIIKFLNLRVILGAVITLLILVIFWGGLLWYLHPQQVVKPFPTAELFIIPAPSLTPSLPSSLIDPQTELTKTPLPGDFAVGIYVQIYATNNAGLRLRSGPGVGHGVQFVGMDGEIYRLQDGPQEADGYTWWYLVSPYDAARSGWAVVDYLTVVSEP